MIHELCTALVLKVNRGNTRVVRAAAIRFRGGRERRSAPMTARNAVIDRHDVETAETRARVKVKPRARA